MQGKVKFYRADKGYGFISREGEDDLFVHNSRIEGRLELLEGDVVEFEIGRGRNGRAEAQRVRIIEEAK